MMTFLAGYPTAGKTTLLNHLHDCETYPCFPEYVTTDEAMPPYPQSTRELNENSAFVLEMEQKRTRDVGDSASVVIDTPPSISLVFLNVVSRIINSQAFPEILDDFLANVRESNILIPNRIVLLEVDFPTVVRRWSRTRDQDLFWTGLRVYREFTRFNRYLAEHLPSLRIDTTETSPSNLSTVVRERVPSPAEHSPAEHSQLLEAYDWERAVDVFDECDRVLLANRGATVNPTSKGKN